MSARTLAKDKYEVGETQTHDTLHYPLSRDSVKLTVSEWVMQKTNQILRMFLSSLINYHRLRKSDPLSYLLSTYYS